MLHNHNPDATWETALVIPEATKPVDVQILDTLLRIEGLLLSRFAPGHTDLMVSPEAINGLQEYNETTAPKAKGRRKS